MKQLLRKFVPGLLLVTLLGSTGWAQGRIATLDLRKVFDGYWKTKQADAALKERAADMEKEHKNMLDDWKKAKDDYQNLPSVSESGISADEQARRKKQAEDKFKYIKDTEDTIAQYERQARTTLDEQKRRMRENILNEIRNVVNAKAKSASYALVMDVAADSANGTPVILFNDNSNDITESVLQQLNVGAPAETAKPAETNEPTLPPIKNKK